MDNIDIISEAVGYSSRNVSNVLALLEEGATIPFIARYRKERTGGMDEVAIREISRKNDELDEINRRKEYILSVINESGKLNDALRKEIEDCTDSNELEDIYLPFKPKRRTRASIAKERGLEPLARIIMSQKCLDTDRAAGGYVKGEIDTVKSAIDGASDIIAEWVSENASIRQRIRNSISRRASLKSKGSDAEGTKYADYSDYTGKLSSIPAHVFLALQRAEKEKVLKLSVETDDVGDIEAICRRMIRTECTHDCESIIRSAVKDGYKRLIKPSIVTEVLNEVKERSDRQSIQLFSETLRQVLLYPPVKSSPVMAIDPGFRTGCKIACLDSKGKLLEYDVIYPVAPVLKEQESAVKVKKLLDKYGIRLIALGDGTASRETERFLRRADLPKDVKIERVSEQGASIYSASETARKEFPNLDLTFRSAVSIGRRLQDPLAELVKIDPKSIGVGQYQHDVNQTWLKEALDFMVERCVNEVGVNINTASSNLLSYVSGIGNVLAENIVSYRNANGAFCSRKDLLKVPRFGQKAFEQASGFLRVPESKNPLDNSAVHPESYHIVESMASKLGVEVKDLVGNERLVSLIDPKEFVSTIAGMDTIRDILSELRKPGRDPRQAQEADWCDFSLSSINDIKEGMLLQGKIVNMTAFGAFVDLGIKTNGLIHVSKISRKKIASPAEVLKMFQIVKVKVIGVDRDRERIALSLIDV